MRSLGFIFGYQKRSRGNREEEKKKKRVETKITLRILALKTCSVVHENEGDFSLIEEGGLGQTRGRFFY